MATGYNNAVNILWLNFWHTISHGIAVVHMDVVAITKASFSWGYDMMLVPRARSGKKPNARSATESNASTLKLR